MALFLLISLHGNRFFWVEVIFFSVCYIFCMPGVQVKCLHYAEKVTQTEPTMLQSHVLIKRQCKRMQDSCRCQNTVKTPSQVQMCWRCPRLSVSSTGLCRVSAGLLSQGNDSAWSATHSAPRRLRRQQQVWRREVLPYDTELTFEPLKTSPTPRPSSSSSSPLGPNRLPFPLPFKNHQTPSLHLHL